MIFGNGMIANALKKSNFFDNFNIIAKGVSNSNESSEIEYLRQEIEIKKCIEEIKLNSSDLRTIYISSLSTGVENLYFTKKKQIESILKESFEDLIIIRLTNVVGFNQNQENIFRYFQYKIKNGEELMINVNAIRNIIDVQDVVSILEFIAKDKFFSCEYEIGFNENISASHLARIIQNYFSSNSSLREYSGQKSSNGLSHINDYVAKYFDSKSITLESYITELLKKYESSGVNIQGA